MYAIYPNKITKYCDVDISKKGIGRGATANVYTAIIENNKNYAVKIFHSANAIDFKRLDLLIKNNPLSEIDTKKDGFEFAWPIAFVSPTKIKKDSIGFLMHKVDKKNSFYLSSIFDSPLKKSSTNPHWPLNLRVSIAIKIAKAVALLHEYFFVICDFKPENILVKKDGSVIFLDCDSFGVDSPSFKLPPTHFSPGYILPELLTSNSPPAKASFNQDLYALSVIIFKILNYGVHPFQGIIKNLNLVDVDSDDDKAKLRLYPYSDKLPNPDILPSPVSIHSFFPDEIKNSFDNIFIHKKNLSANFWSNLLVKYIDNYGFSKCHQFPENIDHIKFNNLDCGVCFINNFNKINQIFPQSNQSITNDSKISTNKLSSSNKDFYFYGSFLIFIFLAAIYIVAKFGTTTKTLSSSSKDDQNNSNVLYYTSQLFEDTNSERIFYNDRSLNKNNLFYFNQINDYIMHKLNNGSNYSFNGLYYYTFDLTVVNYLDFYGSNSTNCTDDSNDIYFYCYRESSSSFKCSYKNELSNFKYICLYSISK